jgi:nucleoside-diphosphate-sugar epimerase
VAALQARDPGPLYLVSDDRPVRRGEFYETLARLLGGPTPHFEPSSAEGPVRGDASKRVSNRRLKRDYGLTLSYPEITTGLPAALEAERGGPPGSA